MPCIFLITKIPLVVYVISCSNFLFTHLSKIEMHNCLGYDKLQKNMCRSLADTHILEACLQSVKCREWLISLLTETHHQGSCHFFMLDTYIIWYATPAFNTWWCYAVCHKHLLVKNMIIKSRRHKLPDKLPLVKKSEQLYYIVRPYKQGYIFVQMEFICSSWL